MQRKDQRTRIGVVGSARYDDKVKIKDLIYTLHNNFHENMIIVTGARNSGAEVHVRKFALDFGCPYVEFNPAHTAMTIYSALSEAFYEKPFNPMHYWHRNKLMVSYIDYLFVFLNKNENDKDMNNIISTAVKMNKPHIIIN